MNVLVTGASGFLGSYVVDELIKKRIKVRTYQRRFVKSLKEKGAKITQGDLTDIKLLNKALKGIDVVIHVGAATTATDRKTNYDTNVIGTKNVVSASIKNKVKKIVFISSINAILVKKSHYGKTKAMAEKIVSSSPINYVIFRPELIYGPNDRGLSKTVSLIKSLPIIPILGSGKAKMQPIFVKDLARIIAEAATKPTKKEVYSAGGPESLSFNQYIDKICTHLKIKKTKIHIPHWLVLLVAKTLSLVTSKSPIPLEQAYSINQDKNGSIDKLKKDFGINPIRFEEGLKKSL